MEVFQQLLALVNAALWNKEIDEKLFSQMNDLMWNDLYLFSNRQGVMAIAFDGVKHLPSNLQPPLKLRMTWALGAEHVEKKYAHTLNVTNELTNILKKDQINMLVFKGLSLSACFPIPAHREFGDIDIYLFGKQKEGDLSMWKAGAKKKDYSSPKHSNSYYKGVLIENHAYFLNVQNSQREFNLNQTLLDILEQDKVEQNIQEGKLLFPSPDFSSLFFMAHAIRHFFAESLPLRTFCDWALFLQAHAHELDIDKWKKALQAAGLLRLAEALTALTFRWLAVPSSVKSQFPIESHPDCEKSISKDIQQPLHHPSSQSTSWQIFRFKCKRFSFRYKRYASFYDGNALAYHLSSFFSSAKYHIRYPQSIFKLR